VQERGEECPVRWSEPYCGVAELPVQQGDLVSQREDLDVFVAITPREQAEQGEGGSCQVK
jgi:hypothetical protein